MMRTSFPWRAFATTLLMAAAATAGLARAESKSNLAVTVTILPNCRILTDGKAQTACTSQTAAHVTVKSARGDFLYQGPSLKDGVAAAHKASLEQDGFAWVVLDY